jgi:hypothetical protein
MSKQLRRRFCNGCGRYEEVGGTAPDLTRNATMRGHMAEGGARQKLGSWDWEELAGRIDGWLAGGAPAGGYFFLHA